MSAPQFSLLAKRRFGPLFVVQFIGAFNDNALKFAMLFLANFTLYAAEPASAQMLATVATGIFILPYFLLSATAGQIADAWDKAKLVRLVKAAEVAFMTLGLAGLGLQSIPLLLLALFLMGCHSALFGPVKFGILPQHLGRHEIMGGTGLVEAGTFLAILGGQLLAGVVAPWQAGLIATCLACLGFLASLAVPPAPPVTADVRIDPNPLRATLSVLKEARGHRGVWLSILGISWFFAVGAVLLASFAPLVAQTLAASQSVATLFLLIFSVSVALGSIAVNRLLGGEVSARFVPASALVLAFALLDLALTTARFSPFFDGAGIAAFVATPGALHILVDLAVISFAGGMFIVPLYAILQTASPQGQRSRIIAANNIVNAAVTVLLVIAITLVQANGAAVPRTIAALGFSTLVVALISCWLLPETVLKALIRGLLKLVYRVELRGAENMPHSGERAVVVVNHVSLLDGLLLAAFLPGKPVFAIHSRFANKLWMKPLFRLFRAFPVDPTNPMAAKAMVKTVREGNVLVIFPEGRITVTGALMKVFDGPGMVADKADAPIVPVRIDGAQFTRFSYLKGKMRLRRFPQITLTVLPPRRFAIEGTMSARERRAVAGRRLYDEMSAMIFATSDVERTLFAALCDARRVHGGKAAVVEDVGRTPLTYNRLIAASLAMGRPLARDSGAGERVGLLLPNVNGAVVAFFALQSIGRVPAMLNYTAGVANLRAACAAADVRTIVTARAFVERAKLDAAIEALASEGIRIRFLEDMAADIGIPGRIGALLASRLTGWRGRSARAEDPAVVLFTSGSEGVPKGVVLTHRNLLSNCHQLSARIDFNASDIVLNALPLFHSFGLTAGTLLPLLNGIRTVLYPNPLHYRIVPALAYDSNATILFGTDTFLTGYARMAHSYDFYSLRYIFAGAERVREETRRTYAEKFGLRILEGYGATEASPVIAVNTPMHFRAGTVGRPLPGVELRLEPVPGIEEGGRLYVRGPNVMAGYLTVDAPGKLQPPADGWHDTGDIVTLDDSGFIAIRGRAKRFAKMGGEMVSLPAVEGYALALWPNADHAVVTRANPRKGEQMVMFTTEVSADVSALQAWARTHGVSELAVPREIRIVDSLPVLGTGKLDYLTMSEMAANPKGSDVRPAA